MESWARRGRRAFLFLAYFLAYLSVVEAKLKLWPFGPKRFSANALINAQSLGLDDGGRVVAFGDFDGDQFLDVLSLSPDQKIVTVYIWNHDEFRFQKNVTIAHPDQISNVVPGDFTHDGKLDVLVMSPSTQGPKEMNLALYAGSLHLGFAPHPMTIPSSTLAQPVPLDANGNMKIDLIGNIPAEADQKTPPLKLWKNVWDPGDEASELFELVDPKLAGTEKTCKMADPHSNAVLDLNGDCLADLLLICEGEKPEEHTFQIWINAQEGGFSQGQTGTLPKGAGAISFADMDRDGTMDMVFPTCDSVSMSTGVGTNCYINIVYNKQRPLCSSTSKGPGCRVREDLCIADPEFKFDFNDKPDNDGFIRFPLVDVVPESGGSLLMFDTTFNPPIPLQLKIGDANLDGFPDLLPIVVDKSGNRTPRLLWSVSCSPHAPGCDRGGKRRGFKKETADVDALTSITDARSVSFLDMDEDGTLDILVQRTGKQGHGTVTFIQNNFFNDAFFLKAIVLNGACGGVCTPRNSTEPQYHPFGVSYSGATYKYTILDTSGRRSAAQIAQLPQTLYQALQTPYAFFGLGRTNNYIENLFVGSTKHDSEYFINMEGVIPNSKVVIIPPVDGRDWKRELYLRPGDWIPWVTLTVVVATIILAIIVFVFHWNEKREDELERRRALHHINFDAL